MAEEPTPQLAASAAPIDNAPTETTPAESGVNDTVVTNGVQAEGSEVAPEVKPSLDATAVDQDKAADLAPSEQTLKPEIENKPTSTAEDTEMKDINTDDAAQVGDESAAGDLDAASGDKSKARRKSGGIPEHKTKKLNKKASKAKLIITHPDAKPGDYFYVKQKGYPIWPGIVASEDMLPEAMIKTRPVTAADKDGIYRADHADGGPKVNNRTFPVMYLYTNEFAWVANFNLLDLDLETVGEPKVGRKRELAEAHVVAAEKHDLDYFRNQLLNFETEKAERAAAMAADAEAKAAAKEEAKAAKKLIIKPKPRKSLSEALGGEEDVEMADITMDPESDGDENEMIVAEKPKKTTKKRKTLEGEDASTPQRADSVKKPKTTLKITNTPKATNGTATPKSAKDPAAPKSAKPKKKATPKPKEPEEIVPPEPEQTPEEKRAKKEKEILFLRHKLQKGLLTKDQEPKQDEMKQMAEFITKLEGYADLEVSIIRATKINKVLKAILKVSNIPDESEHHFKPRSQSLLDKWNKLLASEVVTPAGSTATITNGVKEETKPEVVTEDGKQTPTTSEATNGVKASTEVNAEADVKAEEKASEVKEKTPEAKAPVIESNDESTKGGDDVAALESTKDETVAEPAPAVSAD